MWATKGTESALEGPLSPLWFGGLQAALEVPESALVGFAHGQDAAPQQLRAVRVHLRRAGGGRVEGARGGCASVLIEDEAADQRPGHRTSLFRRFSPSRHDPRH